MKVSEVTGGGVKGIFVAVQVGHVTCENGEINDRK